MSVLRELWARVWGTQPAPPSWEIAACAAVALIVIASPRLWHVTRNAITIAHEGGHALVSLLAGRKLDGIRLHSDTSGVTYSRGRAAGPGMVATAFAGYVTPPLLGLAAAWLLSSDHVTAMLWLLLGLLVATFLAIRNAYGVLAVVATAGAVFAVSYFASAAFQAAFGYAAAWFLLFGGYRPVVELHRQRRRDMRARRPLSTDADQLARLTRLPGGLWVTVFALVALAAIAGGVLLLAPGLWSHLHALR